MTIRTMLPPALASALLLLAPAASGRAAAAEEGGRPITVAMTGAAERPGPGDGNGSGTATFRINPGQMQICYTLSVQGIAAATAAHIHKAPASEAGPVVVPLEAPAEGRSEGCAEVTRALALDIIKAPSDYYVNVHNAAFPAGAVRGQLGK